MSRLSFTVFALVLIGASAVKAERLDLEPYAAQIETAEHARFEAAFILSQLPSLQNRLIDASKSTNEPKLKSSEYVEVGHYAGWMWFRYGQASSAHRNRDRSGFDKHFDCGEAAYHLQQLAYTYNRALFGYGKTTVLDILPAAERYDAVLVSCAKSLGFDLD